MFAFHIQGDPNTQSIQICNMHGILVVEIMRYFCRFQLHLNKIQCRPAENELAESTQNITTVPGPIPRQKNQMETGSNVSLWLLFRDPDIWLYILRNRLTEMGLGYP